MYSLVTCCNNISWPHYKLPRNLHVVSGICRISAMVNPDGPQWWWGSLAPQELPHHDPHLTSRHWPSPLWLWTQPPLDAAPLLSCSPFLAVHIASRYSCWQHSSAMYSAPFLVSIESESNDDGFGLILCRPILSQMEETPFINKVSDMAELYHWSVKDTWGSRQKHTAPHLYLTHLISFGFPPTNEIAWDAWWPQKL